ncbi:hypothetical protein Fmac_013699 [Flemingia macrophylla]|uniref:Uncharacterized protein n=1 Tax=Flemingia macrophylla TaxID=520843 RepID=A0ABD1MTV3_9FABA
MTSSSFINFFILLLLLKELNKFIICFYWKWEEYFSSEYEANIALYQTSLL